MATLIDATRKPSLTPSHWIAIHGLTLKQHIWLIVLSTLIASTIVVAICSLLRPEYSSTATLCCDTSILNHTTIDWNHGKNADSLLATQERLIQTDRVIRSVALRYRLIEREGHASPSWFRHPPAEAPQKISNAPLSLRRLKVKRIGNTYCISITYTDREAQVAADVANSVAISYLVNFGEQLSGHLTSHQVMGQQTAKVVTPVNRAWGTVEPSSEQSDAERTSQSDADDAKIERMNQMLYPLSFLLSKGLISFDDVATSLQLSAETAGSLPEPGALQPKLFVTDGHASSAAARTAGLQDTKRADQIISPDFTDVNFRLVDRARASTKPSFPNWPFIVFASVGFFGFMSSGLVIAFHRGDFAVTDASLIEESCGITVVSTIPTVPNILGRLLNQPNSTLVRDSCVQELFFDEAIRSLHNNLLLSMPRTDTHSILVASGLPGEGKTSVAIALAMAFHAQGKRTLLVDADLRSPAVDDRLHINPPGRLESVLTSAISWKAALSGVAGYPHLSVLGSDAPLSGSIGLIGGLVRKILAEAAPEFDVVILDSPPLLGCGETIYLASIALSTVLIVRGGKTPFTTLAKTIESMQRIGVTPAGIVLNGVSMEPDTIYRAYEKYHTAHVVASMRQSTSLGFRSTNSPSRETLRW